MFKRAIVASALLLSSSAFANIAVEVKNESRIYDVELTSKDYQTSRYSPNQGKIMNIFRPMVD